MTIWANTIKRSLGGEKRKEDCFFPYSIEELEEYFNKTGFIGTGMAKKITWFFEDISGKKIAFSEEFCNKILNEFQNFKSKESNFSFFCGDQPDADENFVGVWASNFWSGKKSAPIDGIVYIYKDEKLKGHKFKML